MASTYQSQAQIDNPPSTTADGYSLVFVLIWLAIIGLALCNVLYLGYIHWYRPWRAAREHSQRTQDFRRQQDLESQRHQQNAQPEPTPIPLQTLSEARG
ncbi:hypothetical protein PG999_001707 [Apiospora kogelbergensis]|uniref:Uncharacterized protein n=1 Tax=Apiospora kogelbergensis TaxID=1337665 RepID=A0AAW0R631_9PEZI